MQDITHQRKSNLSTSSTHPTETGERVQPASARGPLSLGANPESTPEDIKPLGLCMAWKPQYRPHAGRTKAGSQWPIDAASGRKAQPVAWPSWGACEQATASHSVVRRWRQLSLRIHHTEADGSSCQGYVIPTRGGLSHG
jgi:hypothetical protein